jgi:phosphoribosylformimino-5-aminoimidazole carboxamide ribotide isomerase
MQVIPSIDLQSGRSRLVYWPGASSGTGTPTDRPDRIARAFVEAGAQLIHLVDLDGAAMGRPANLSAISEVARAVATPLQVAGGVDGPEQIEVAFAAGATRVVMPLHAVAEDPERLGACLRIAGDWLAVGIDARPDRLRDFPWRSRSAPLTLAELVDDLAGAGVRRFVLSHGGSSPDQALIVQVATGADLELLVAGGIDTLEQLQRVRDVGVAGVILGEALFKGQIPFEQAVALAA